MRAKVGDLLNAEELVIMHGCNCQGVMGAGVAKQIKNKWPVVYEKYSQYCPNNDLIGNIQAVDVGDKLIINAFTQVYYGSKHRNFNYRKFKVIVRKVKSLCLKYGFDKVAIPCIGAGLGKGSWSEIRKILESYEVEGEFEFVVYSL
ncbi:MAG: macro domain-containing protein [Parcubacteria group bacterium]